MKYLHQLKAKADQEIIRKKNTNTYFLVFYLNGWNGVILSF